ncbi:hypothetical protein A3I56_00740 [Candidatus Roizmanbacteria bacterium RIFCSPLOWO2_02_FULL_43_10]|uniref:Nudix hydrolase domain-containing protein n=2 Tax=Candidatus Roizmaniibacteriota TaxID=1752723 RepID=A0A1F7JVW7_9BACT|nr:MAG: hypothetical protein A3F32_02885 [Candidatus Roizmanbacteria bacterium RIFCSPHIGHO2_12_FULL_42_10]OGK59745.1 MAG: hypothetical protein A3I56_00740 [Candidatus Roizmanbacteria bacterium RIFCSPLOWO2_02_FULL_43_10]
MPTPLHKIYQFCPRCGARFAHHSPTLAKCETCGLEHYINPKPVVNVLLIEPDNEIFLIKRGQDPMKGKWALVGGFCDPNETFEQTAVREALEELNVKIEPDYLLGSVAKESIYNDIMYPILGVCVVAHITDGQPKAGDDAEDFIKISPTKALKTLPLIESTVFFLDTFTSAL